MVCRMLWGHVMHKIIKQKIKNKWTQIVNNGRLGWEEGSVRVIVWHFVSWRSCIWSLLDLTDSQDLFISGASVVSVHYRSHFEARWPPKAAIVFKWFLCRIWGKSKRICVDVNFCWNFYPVTEPLECYSEVCSLSAEVSTEICEEGQISFCEVTPRFSFGESANSYAMCQSGFGWTDFVELNFKNWKGLHKG
jgi:hypothetical protein